MDIIKPFVAFIVVAVAAYAQFEAESAVKLKNETDQKLQDLKAQITEIDFAYMKRAINLTNGADRGNQHAFGCIVVKADTIIGQGWNRTKMLHDPSAHAEVEAIRDACKKTHSTTLEGAVIYTSTEPCPMCLSLIYMTGVEKVYYSIPNTAANDQTGTASVDEIYDALTRPQIDRPIQEIQIMQHDVSLMLTR